MIRTFKISYKKEDKKQHYNAPYVVNNNHLGRSIINLKYKI